MLRQRHLPSVVRGDEAALEGPAPPPGGEVVARPDPEAEEGLDEYAASGVELEHHHPLLHRRQPAPVPAVHQEGQLDLHPGEKLQIGEGKAVVDGRSSPRLPAGDIAAGTRCYPGQRSWMTLPSS